MSKLSSIVRAISTNHSTWNIYTKWTNLKTAISAVMLQFVRKLQKTKKTLRFVKVKGVLHSRHALVAISAIQTGACSPFAVPATEVIAFNHSALSEGDSASTIKDFCAAVIRKADAFSMFHYNIVLIPRTCPVWKSCVIRCTEISQYSRHCKRISIP